MQVEVEPTVRSRREMMPRTGPGVVLVIDDDPMVLQGMSLVLRQLGWDVLAAESPEHALDLVAPPAARPDFIIADYRLRGGRTGIDAIRSVRAALGHAVRAVLLTGETSPERLREARASGLTVLHKPVTFGELSRHLPMTDAA